MALNGTFRSIYLSISFYLMCVELIGEHQLRSYERMGKGHRWMEAFNQYVSLSLSISCVWISLESINLVATRWWVKNLYEWNTSLDLILSIFLSRVCGSYLVASSLWLRDDGWGIALYGTFRSIYLSISFHLMCVDLIGAHQLRSYEKMGKAHR